MPQTQDTDTAETTVDDFAPRPASMHLIAADRTERAITGPIATDPRFWPLAPWRLVLVLVAIGTGAACAPPAADPATGFNGADLGVLISLAIFVAAVAIRSPRRKETR
ncbi:hypothetical protein CJ226_08980 [Microbacterium sp. UMB0228]|uniref:hypothetical protein n=1 Tax=Microbacterium sp. UMB0228 TaxID=2029109 RepID=UPI000C80DAB7|nr:hypothetical protein [Microbacterium sp. UMB0228]PMC04130.1 hypothetical protein CJ226_08980 [Microbacterium sp. UMB0228]